MKDNKVIFWSIIKGLEEIVPLQPAKNYIPEWWKNTPSFMPNMEQEAPIPREGGTIKICPSVHDWFSQGYVLPMWYDVHIDIKENGEIKVLGSDQNLLRNSSFMIADAYTSWLPEQQKKQAVAVIRLACPWRMKTPVGYSCYQFPMWYHFNPDFEVPPGPVWSDEYHLIDPQIILKHYGEIKIKRGTPLCVFVPYKREPDDTFHYEIKRRDEECEILEQKTELMVRTKMIGGYKEMQKEKGGCPMHKEHE
jgi:hypothetical protein